MALIPLVSVSNRLLILRATLTTYLLDIMYMYWMCCSSILLMVNYLCICNFIIFKLVQNC